MSLQRRALSSMSDHGGLFGRPRTAVQRQSPSSSVITKDRSLEARSGSDKTLIVRSLFTPTMCSVKDSVQISPDVGQCGEQLIISWSSFVNTMGSTSVTVVYICEGIQDREEE